MSNIFFSIISFLLIGFATSCSTARSTSLPPVTAATPAPAARSAAVKKQTAVFAGGCFWGVEAVFEHVKGVIDVRSGYSGGSKETADYETVSDGRSGHAESVEVVYDANIVTYEQLLFVFFTVAHDPTQLNFQGPDHGTQYRSAIFFANDEQKTAAMAFIDALNKSKAYSGPIVTEVSPLKEFYAAEDYHQNYMKFHPNDSYIVYNDKPKVAALKAKFPDLYVEK